MPGELQWPTRRSDEGMLSVGDKADFSSLFLELKNTVET